MAILSKNPLSEINLYPHCGRNDARHISATVSDLSVHSLYVPAGSELPDAERNPKFAHKLKFCDAVADLAAEINASVENIGARRLHTVLEKLLEEISSTAIDRSGETFKVDAAYVRTQVGELAKKGGLSRFIL